MDTFEDLVRDSADSLLRKAYLLTGERFAAEDLVQSALITTYLHWSSLRDRHAAEAYARKVLVNTYARSWSRKWRGEMPTENPPEAFESDAFAASDERDHLRRALATLSKRQRAVVVLRHYLDMSEADVSEMLGMATGTVKSTNARALKLLRAYEDDGRVTT